MSDCNTPFKQKFSAVAAEFNTPSLHDKAKIVSLGGSLEELAQENSRDLAPVMPLLDMVLEGLKDIYEDKSTETDKLIEPISKTVHALTAFIDSDNKNNDRLNDAGLSLWCALGRDAQTYPNIPVMSTQQDMSPEIQSQSPATPISVPLPNDPHLIEEFVTESVEFIQTAEQALLILETDPQDLEALNTVFRAFHTIKGTSSFLGFKTISELSHMAENLLTRIRNKEIRYAGGYADLALCSLDMLKILVEKIRDPNRREDVAEIEGYARLIEIFLNPEAAGISEKSSDEVVGLSLRLGDILVSQGKVTRDKMEELAAGKGPEFLGLTLIKSNAASLVDVGKALRLQQRLKNSHTALDTSVRVSTERLDRFITEIDELAVAYSMIIQDRSIYLTLHDELLRKVTHVGKIIHDLQDMSMSIRMIPLHSTFQKMSRLVRDVAHKSSKLVNFVSSGEDIEIDRTIIDGINDALVHLIRNAVDHGIESPQLRQESGKPNEGTLRLHASYRSGNILIEVSDDGKGLNHEKIIKKAIALNLLEPTTTITEVEALNLIFTPGFSTADKVTDISGRGVGLDVVKRAIESYKGRIDVESKVSQGTTFRITLPLTMAIITGSLVKVGIERYIVPSDRILSSVHAQSDSLSINNGEETLIFEGRPIPIIRLHKIFKVRDALEDIIKGLLLIVKSGETCYALLVDEFLGKQQVVVKSLGQSLGKIGGISGRAILGDGCIGLILDPQDMITSTQKI